MSLKSERGVQEERSISQWPGFWAMVGKEVKRNIAWAVAITITTGIGLVLGIYQVLPSTSQFSMMKSSGYYDIWINANFVFTWTTLLGALLLALLQIIPEQRRDQWAFFIHRPATRSLLFWAKTCAGLLLYVISLLIPLLLLVEWARMPGNVAGPFDWRLTWGVIGSTISCVPFYFAALLTALRPARWWGSKAIPILGAFVIALIATSAIMFSSCLITSIIGSAIYAIAACVAMNKDGQYGSFRKLPRFDVALIIYIGLWLVLGGVLAAGISIYNSNFHTPNTIVAASGLTTQYQLSDSGQVVCVEGFNQVDIFNVKTLSGKPVRHAHTEKEFSFMDEMYFLTIHKGWPLYDQVNYNDPHVYSRAILGGHPGEEWYYSKLQHRFIGYNMHTRLPVGTLTPSGFYKGDDRTPPGFPGRLRLLIGSEAGTYFLGFSHADYILNLQSQTITKLPLPPGGHAMRYGLALNPVYIGRSYNTTGDTGVPANQFYYIIANQDCIQLLSPEGKILFSVPRALPHSQYPSLQITSMDYTKGITLWYSKKTKHLSGQIFEYNSHGFLIKHIILPPLPRPKAIPMKVPTNTSLYGIVLPPFVAGGFLLYDYFIGKVPFTQELIINIAPLTMLIGICQMAFVAGVISALLAFLIARRCAYTRSGTWAWTIGTFFLGLPGVLLMLALREWPAQEVCSNCHKKRVVTREFCEHCGAPWAAKALDGTEIFEGGSAS